MSHRFYKCNKCGNIYEVVKDSGCQVFCCGVPMEEIIPGAVDASEEKHVPVVTQEDNTVRVVVGEALHPMAGDHYIEWISIDTREGIQRKELSPEAPPEASFLLSGDDELVSVYACCNLHGLWKKEV